jgi:hypothetical protein
MTTGGRGDKWRRVRRRPRSMRGLPRSTAAAALLAAVLAAAPAVAAANPSGTGLPSQSCQR